VPGGAGRPQRGPGNALLGRGDQVGAALVAQRDRKAADLGDRLGDAGVILACLLMGTGLSFGVIAIARYTFDWLGYGK